MCINVPYTFSLTLKRKISGRYKSLFLLTSPAHHFAEISFFYLCFRQASSSGIYLISVSFTD